MRRQGKRASKRDVFGAQSHGLGGQNQHGVLFVKMCERSIDHAIDQHRVDIQGQMGPVLLGRAQGQNRHGARGVEQREVLAVHSGPAVGS